jgi:transcriptional regulator with XRE-family HTH domain
MEAAKVGGAIRELRKRAGYSQQQLAEHLGVTDKAVSRWERGIGIPDISIITKLSMFLNVDTDNLLDGNVSFLNHDWEGELRVHQYPCGLNPLSEVHNRPLIHFWLSCFLLIGVKTITVIGDAGLIDRIERAIGDGKQYGVMLRYGTKTSERAKNIILIDGSFFLYGTNLTRYFQRALSRNNGITVFAAPTFLRNRNNVFFRGDRRLSLCNEGPEMYQLLPVLFIPAPFSRMYLDNSVDCLIEKGVCYAEPVGRGMLYFPLKKWQELDHVSQIATLVHQTTGEFLFCLEEIAWRRGLIDGDALRKLADPDTEVGKYLLRLTEIWKE